jgi:hypothetical protein
MSPSLMLVVARLHGLSAAAEAPRYQWRIVAVRTRLTERVPPKQLANGTGGDRNQAM